MGGMETVQTFGTFTVPEHYRPLTIGKCRSCRAAILWSYTPGGAMAPSDRDGTSHFATCPDAASYRRRRKR